MKLKAAGSAVWSEKFSFHAVRDINKNYISILFFVFFSLLLYNSFFSFFVFYLFLHFTQNNSYSFRFFLSLSLSLFGSNNFHHSWAWMNDFNVWKSAEWFSARLTLYREIFHKALSAIEDFIAASKAQKAFSCMRKSLTTQRKHRRKFFAHSVFFSSHFFRLFYGRKKVGIMQSLQTWRNIDIRRERTRNKKKASESFPSRFYHFIWREKIKADIYFFFLRNYSFVQVETREIKQANHIK